MGKYRKLTESRGWAFVVAPAIIKPILLSVTKQDWEGGEKIPAEGGCVLVFNHVSHADPLTVAHLVWDYGRKPLYLAKAGVFKYKVFGAFLHAAGQIPVERSSSGATAFQAAVDAVDSGGAVCVYIEGSITKDPNGWPMKGKSGAARIGLATGCPVIPIGQWGAQELLPAYSARLRPFPRKPIHMKVGDPVDLSDLLGKEMTPEVIAEATDRIIRDLTGLVADLRGEQPPEKPFDPRTAGVAAYGNPNKGRKSKKEKKSLKVWGRK